MTRLDRMRQNQERTDTLELKHILTSLKDFAQPNCAKGKRSRASVVVDDDYVPPIGDDDNDEIITTPCFYYWDYTSLNLIIMYMECIIF